jgi:GR25 family glycosyltransferase involved in LPS biosynthesis
MNNIVSKTYVINLKSRPDRWTDINLKFKDSGLKLNRWNATNGKKLSENKINKLTTPLCNLTCSPGMIGCSLSHYNLWKHIVKNKENNVLILEDDCVPIDNFKNELKIGWNDVPNDFDLIFLGCHGSCENSFISKILFKTMSNSKNVPVFNKGMQSDYIFKPCFPLCTHAYIVSLVGAKKLINHPKLQKIAYHIDYILSKHVFPNPDFKMFAFKKRLINQQMSANYSDNQSMNHPLISKYGSKIKISDVHTISECVNTQLFGIRKLGLNISVLIVLISIMSFIIGLCGNKKIIIYYLLLVIFYYLLEFVLYTKVYIDNKKIIIFELFFMCLFIHMGFLIKN